MLADLRFALRWLRRSPGFACVAILSLGLGIGANAAMFSLVDAVLLKPLPVTDPASLTDVFTTGGDGSEYATTSYPDFLDLQARNAVFSEMTAYSMMLAPLGLGDRARLALGHIVTANHFDMLGVRPLMGRVFQPADEEPGAERVAVISEGLWRSDFGADPGIVGRTLQIRGASYTIAGVVPASFTGVIPMLRPELWVPVVQADDVEPAGINDVVPSPTGRTRIERRGSRWLFVKGRLKPGVSLAEAQANVGLLAAQLTAEHPETNRSRNMHVVATADVPFLVPQSAGPLAAGATGLMAVVGLVLLIACANVAGMLLARAASRRREISLRLAIGAGRGQIVRQLLVEGLVLGLCGAVVAVLLAWAIVRALLSIELPLPAAVVLDVPLDLRVVAFAVVVALAAGVLAALMPALKTSSMRLAGDLRGDAPLARVGGRRWAMHDVLVVGQLALTLVLLVVAGLLLRTLNESRDADVGFRADGLAMVSADPSMLRYAPEQSQQFWTRALEQVRALPGVQSAALVTPRLPFDLNFSQTSVRIDGRDYARDARGETVATVSVSPDYFETLDVPVLAGRTFTTGDHADAPRVAVINDTMARQFWPEGGAVGRTLRLSNSQDVPIQVVGVVADHRQHTVAERPAPSLHLALPQRPGSYAFVVARTRGDAPALLSAMRGALLMLEPGLVFMSSRTMEAAVSAALLPQRVSAALAAAFGAVGTLLAAVGLYGVIAFAVARRTREIGVRLAVGAEARDVLVMIMRQGLTLAVIGAIAGALVAAAVGRVLAGVLYGVGAFDPVSWGAALMVLFAAAAVANAVPAWRAMRLDPVRALRTE